jgi:ferric-dicitrate binding protein FerR (iron transport regulator)
MSPRFDDDELGPMVEATRNALQAESMVSARSRSVHLARKGVLDGTSRRASAKPFFAPRKVVFALGIAMCAVFVARVLRPPAVPTTAVPIACTVRGVPATLGERIDAQDARVLDFNDGTRVEGAANSVVRLLSLDDRGAHVLLEQGLLHVDVRHREHTAWRFEAGGVNVHVTGTRFDIAFNPVAQTFDLAMHEGSVRVSGCDLKGDRIAKNTETVHANCAPVQGDSVAPPPPDALAIVAPTEVPKESLRRAPVPTPPPADESMAWLLRADAERRGGNNRAAYTFLLDARQRFPKGIGAARAAFDLGVLAFDVHEDFDDAATWFATYLQEAPHGPLEREALGRLMEAEARSEHHDRAALTAHRYLEQFPKGPHALLAKDLTAIRR